MASFNLHGGHNPKGKIACGAVGLLDESEQDRIIKNKVISILRANGHTVYDCTEDNGTSQSDVLKKIVAKCNAHKVDLDVSIHFNSGANDTNGNGATTGSEVWIYKDSSSSKTAAQRIVNNLASVGFKNRGVKTSTGLYVLKKTKSPALLVEVCFVDDKDDYNLYINNVDRIAKAIADGIVGATLSSGNSAPSTPTPTPTTTNQLYRVRKSWSDVKSQTGAYKDLSNAKRECPNGYSVFDSNGNVVYTNGTIQVTNTAPTVTAKPSAPASSSSTTSKYYLANTRVRGWQSAMNKGFDLKGNDVLVVDGKFGEASQSCASSHNLWSGQKHNCPTAINWLRKTLHDTYRFTKLPTTGKWDAYLTTCVKVFQKNRGLTQDGRVGLITTYYLLKG